MADNPFIPHTEESLVDIHDGYSRAVDEAKASGDSEAIKDAKRSLRGFESLFKTPAYLDVETNHLHYVRRPEAIPMVKAWERQRRIDVVIEGVKAFFVSLFWFACLAFAVLVVIAAIMSDGIWTDRETGCRYRADAWGAMSPMLLPSGLPDCTPKGDK